MALVGMSKGMNSAGQGGHSETVSNWHCDIPANCIKERGCFAMVGGGERCRIALSHIV